MGRAATPSKSLFGRQLDKQLASHPTVKSYRGLAKELNGGSHNESRRVLIHKWVAGDKRPTIASRRAVAEVLGVDVSVFADPDDEEEDQVYRALLRHVTGTLKLRKETGDPFALDLL